MVKDNYSACIDPDRETSRIELELSGGGELSIHTSGFTGNYGGRTQVWFQGLGFGSSLSMDSEELLELGLFLAKFGKRIRDQVWQEDKR